MLQTIDPFPGHYDADDGFGSTKGRDYGHTGIDWGGGLGGQPIPCWAAGTVVRNAWSAGNGWTLALDLDDCDLYGSYIHMANQSPLAVGSHVALGQEVGVVGGTGTNARGPHLHSSLSDSPGVNLGLGKLQDPWAFIQAHLTAAPTSPKPPQEELGMNIIVHTNRDPQDGNTVDYQGSSLDERFPHVYLINTATFEGRHLLTTGVVQAYEALGFTSNYYGAELLAGYAIPTPS